MVNAKLRIDLQQGLLEVEGSDELVREIYLDFKDQLHGSEVPKKSTSEPSTTVKAKPPKADIEISAPLKSTGKKRSSAGTNQPTMDKNLDLSGVEKGVERLKEFHSMFKISSNLERNLVFMYYLQNKLEISPITPNHVFTCYRDVGVKVPTALVQSLRDTANRRGWIDTANTNDLKITVAGINYLEHDLEKAKNES